MYTDDQGFKVNRKSMEVDITLPPSLLGFPFIPH